SSSASSTAGRSGTRRRRRLERSRVRPRFRDSRGRSPGGSDMARMNFGRQLSRRTVLRGGGATLALPFLGGMVPAFAAVSPRSPRRLGFVYAPNGMNMTQWTPAAEGALQLTPILKPLAPVQDKLVVVSGLGNNAADQVPGEGGGDHSRSSAA